MSLFSETRRKHYQRRSYQYYLQYIEALSGEISLSLLLFWKIWLSLQYVRAEIIILLAENSMIL